MSTDMDIPTDTAGNEIGKIFVGGLSQNTDTDSLRSYFAQFGEIEDAAVMMDNRTNRSRGFGYVRYKDPNIVDMILNSNNPHVVDGKEVDPKQCNVNMKGKNRRSLKIFVGGIAPEHDEGTVKEFFSQYGTVTDVNLMMDISKQRHRGFAFVGFEDETTVKRLIQIHHVQLNGKQVEIKPMEPPNYARRMQGPPGMQPGPPSTRGGRGRGGGPNMWNGPNQGWGQSWNNPNAAGGWHGGAGSNWGQGGWDQNGWSQWGGQQGGWDQMNNNWQQMQGGWGNQSGGWGGQAPAGGWDGPGPQGGWGGPPSSMYGGSGDYSRGGGSAAGSGVGGGGGGTGGGGGHSYHPYKRQ